MCSELFFGALGVKPVLQDGKAMLLGGLKTLGKVGCLENEGNVATWSPTTVPLHAPLLR